MKKLLLTTVMILACSSISFADDATIVTSFDGTGSILTQSFEHDEGAPFKGLVEVTLTNTGSDPWGDFHFEIYDPLGTQDISNVHFIDSTLRAYDLGDGNGQFGVDPTYTAFPGTANEEDRSSSLAWSIDNDSVGAKMDLYFYGNPILPTETVKLVVMTDNTQDQLGFFGLKIYPTPVPEPATMLLLGLGGLVIRRKK